MAILNALGQPLREVVYDSNNKPMILTRAEQVRANIIQKKWDEEIKNSLGFDISITTLTTVVKKVTEQKFFQLAPADYLPVKVGEGAWSDSLTTYRAFHLADDFSTGLIDTGANNDRLATGDAGVDSLNIKVYNWAKAIGWTIFDLNLAAKSGNWDLVTGKEKSRKKNWDLGIQEIAFLGIAGSPQCQGLLNQSGCTVDTTTLTQAINTLSTANLSTFIAKILNVYRSNCSRSAWPTHFVIPESDYLGLATPTSSSFPLKSILELMLETFITMTGNKNFKILPCAYGDAAYNSAVINHQRYALYNYEEESLVMNIPVDYTNTLANSLDNFSFQNAAYGQFTGALALRQAEMYYFQF